VNLCRIDLPDPNERIGKKEGETKKYQGMAKERMEGRHGSKKEPG